MENVHALPRRQRHSVLDGAGPAARRAGPHETDAAYFRRRANEERAFADRVRDQHSRDLHLEIAQLYEDLSATLRESQALDR
jgi:hypothetical protein